MQLAAAWLCRVLPLPAHVFCAITLALTAAGTQCSYKSWDLLALRSVAVVIPIAIGFVLGILICVDKQSVAVVTSLSGRFGGL